VADVACGSGSWISDLAHSSPKFCRNCEYGGFDIAREAFPKVEEWSRLKFVQHDCSQRFSDEWLERFYVVHIRLLVYAITEADLKSLLKNVVEILKPGGYLQWAEADMKDWRAVPRESSVNFED
ncbi:S-adenosyl-L-methionine-dependent methyltransferase, partial [Halenospora varia]